MTLSTGGFSPGLAVSKVYDGTWVDDRRCGKGTVGAVAYSNGEVEVCSFQASASHHTAVAALTYHTSLASLAALAALAALASLAASAAAASAIEQ